MHNSILRIGVFLFMSHLGKRCVTRPWAEQNLVSLKCIFHARAMFKSLPTSSAAAAAGIGYTTSTGLDGAGIGGGVNVARTSGVMVVNAPTELLDAAVLGS